MNDDSSTGLKPNIGQQQSSASFLTRNALLASERMKIWKNAMRSL